MDDGGGKSRLDSQAKICVNPLSRQVKSRLALPFAKKFTSKDLSYCTLVYLLSRLTLINFIFLQDIPTRILAPHLRSTIMELRVGCHLRNNTSLSNPIFTIARTQQLPEMTSQRN